MNFFQTLSAAIVEQSMAKKTQWRIADCGLRIADCGEADAARGFSPLDVPPPRRVLPFQPEMRRIA